MSLLLLRGRITRFSPLFVSFDNSILFHPFFLFLFTDHCYYVVPIPRLTATSKLNRPVGLVRRIQKNVPPGAKGVELILFFIIHVCSKKLNGQVTFFLFNFPFWSLLICIEEK